MKCIPILLSIVLAQNDKDIRRTFGLYDQRKHEFVFVPYTANQKIQVAQTVLNLMNVYVNRETKVKHYGYGVDPLPKAEAMVIKAGSLSDKDFHYQMLDIFNPLRDLHTVYAMPGPHGCLHNVKAISFSIADAGVNEKIVVQKFSGFREVLHLSGNLGSISLGDELLSVDGVPIQRYLQIGMLTSVGSNPFASKRRVLERMSVIPGTVAVPPTKQDTTYVLKSVKTSREYTVTLPWVTMSREDCYPPAVAVYRAVLSGTPMEQLPVIADPPINTPIPINAPDFRTMLRQAGFGKIPLNKFVRLTNELEYMIYAPKNLGVIVVKSFYADDGLEFLKQLLNVIVFQLATVKAILIDVRGNGGGTLFLTEAIPQLFKKEKGSIQPFLARALNSPLNRDLMMSRKYPYKQWTSAMQTSHIASQFTNFVQLTPTALTNVIKSPILEKPVAILNDATCYSACDIFSALFQDNFVGTVFGEDGSTGRLFHAP